jgi:ubiquinone/menaquinone biosynthesis C-methylase UbiE
MKDRFSSGAKQYAQFRPIYPDALFNYILKHVASRTNALDVGTGNGQVAAVLADHFQHVYATDISAEQLQQAPAKSNSVYSVQPAEKLNFSDSMFDLIVSAQAVHWFEFADFFGEVKRLLKPDGIIALWGYGLIETNGELNNIINKYYKTLHTYWDAERRHIEDGYASIPFPFTSIPAPAFSIHVQWTKQQLQGYLSTWSAAKNFIAQHGYDPLEEVSIKLEAVWGNDDTRSFSFPLFTKMGRQQ